MTSIIGYGHIADNNGGVTDDTGVTNGMRIFDMTALSWSDQYDSQAVPYARAAILTKALK